MSITRLETHQSSSQQIKIMTHITPGEIIAITSKCQIPWTDLINTTPAQGHHLPSIDNSMIEEEKARATKMVSSCDVIFVKVCIYGPELPRKIWFILYTTSHSFSIRFQPPWTDQKLGIWVLKCSSTRWSYKYSCKKRMVQLLHKQFVLIENKNKTS